jgi:hypothetical protein
MRLSSLGEWLNKPDIKETNEEQTGIIPGIIPGMEPEGSSDEDDFGIFEDEKSSVKQLEELSDSVETLLGKQAEHQFIWFPFPFLSLFFSSLLFFSSSVFGVVSSADTVSVHSRAGRNVVYPGGYGGCRGVV